MKVKDKNLKQTVDVYNDDCLDRDCYWPRTYPGVFVQGRGYTQTKHHGWICGTREIHGCPSDNDDDD